MWRSVPWPACANEHGGAFIDSSPPAALHLVRELGLHLEVFNGGDLPAGSEVYWFNGGYYTYAEASEDWANVGFNAFHAAVRESSTPAGQLRLDGLSATEWLDETPTGSSSRFGQLMLANTVSENGGDPADQSSWTSSRSPAVTRGTRWCRCPEVTRSTALWAATIDWPPAWPRGAGGHGRARPPAGCAA